MLLITAIVEACITKIWSQRIFFWTAEFTCPPWFSPEAKKLLKSILNPNPLTKIKIPEILEDEWVKKGYKPASFTEEDGINVDDVAATFNDSKENLVTETKEKPVSMNAFELISRSQSFNLDNLFEKQKMKLQGDKSGRKGQLSVATEVFNDLTALTY
ncbi:Non-specific serine threonine protein kinase [Trifolium repens]|nr:Non-specific serine threonine protein kinase [Trifolium repens]